MNISTFDELLDAARAQPQPHRLLFAASMSGTRGRAPSSVDADQPLQHMVESIRQGRIRNFIPFDPQGRTVQLG